MGGLRGRRKGSFFSGAAGGGDKGFTAGLRNSSGETRLAKNSAGFFLLPSGIKYSPIKMPAWIIIDKTINFFIVKRCVFL
jgi:hypothetical protein